MPAPTPSPGGGSWRKRRERRRGKVVPVPLLESCSHRGSKLPASASATLRLLIPASPVCAALGKFDLHIPELQEIAANPRCSAFLAMRRYPPPLRLGRQPERI